MKRILIISLLFTYMIAGEGFPALTFPELAQDGYFPSVPAKAEDRIDFSYASWFYDTDYSVLSAHYGNYYFGFKGLISGNIEIRGDQPSPEPVGTTAYYNTVLYAGRSWEFNGRWTANTKIKLLNERLFYASAWGAAADAEAVFSFNARYRALAGVENIGYMSALNEVPTRIPARYYVGGEVTFNVFILSLEAGLNRDLDTYYRFGARYVHPVFDISYSYDKIQMTHHIGADVKWSKYRVGYGQFFHREGLGNPLMFTFGMQF
ncbi:MAG: hypothetical protein U5N26_04295 [Candidatus Marinimicrobia bacterium]|nr:hypothetical protein [Candidatus Neomarinimicrobiota bacterium]